MSSLTADLETAARIGGDERGGVTRFAWSPELAQANSWLMDQLAELGLAAELDPAGNVIGRWTAGEGKAVALGSHLDTVPAGGRYDGALGVLAALDVVRRLKAEGVEPRRPLWVISFNDEEGGRFQTGMLGSRAFCGDCDLEDWERRGSQTRWQMPASTSAAWARRRAWRARRLPRATHRAGAGAGAQPRRPRRRHGDHGNARLPGALHRRGQPRRHDPDGASPRRARGGGVWCWRSARWRVAATT